MAQEISLPKGWSWTSLGEIGKLLRGVSFPKEDVRGQPEDDLVPILRATNIQNEKLILDNELVYVPSKYVKHEQYLEVGDIVVCMSSGSKHLVGKTAQLFRGWGGSFGTFCAAIRPFPIVNANYLGFYFSSPDYRQFIRNKSAGININNLKPADFEALEIPLPPLLEQERIVAKIEALFTQLDAGTAALRRVQAGLKRYKASVLKAACEGRLVDSRVERRELNEGELPEGWRWVTVGDIANKVTDGTHKTPKYTNNGIPFISVNNLSENGVIDFTKTKYISSTEHKELIRHCSPEKGDVLLSKVGTVGLTAVIRSERVFSLFVNTALIKPIQEIVDAEYLAFALRFGFLAKLFDRYISGSTQKFIGTNKISQLPIPLPPLSEQRCIVAEVERRLSVVQEIESVVEASLARTNRLRQAILKQAFEGKLVAQSSSDEPTNLSLTVDKFTQSASKENSPENLNGLKKTRQLNLFD